MYNFALEKSNWGERISIVLNNLNDEESEVQFILEQFGLALYL